MKGKLIAIEGMDFSGKTTTALILKELLEKRGYEVVLSREPGGTEAGEKIRDILIHTNLTQAQQALLFQTSRSLHCEELIRPALEAGKIVITDRYIISSLVYQHSQKDLLGKLSKELNLIEPDMMIYTHCSYEETIKRKAKRDDINLLDEQHTNRFVHYKGLYDYYALALQELCCIINTELLSADDIRTKLDDLINNMMEDIKHE